MPRRIAVILSTLFIALGILAVSLLRSASVNYAFSGPLNMDGVKGAKTDIKIDYSLPYPGKILPDSSLWPIKALRDKIWLALTVNSSRRAELLLLFADKRLEGSKTLFERKKSSLAFSSLTKAEKYLEEALETTKQNRKKGLDTSSFDAKLAKAALRHRQVIEEILSLAPEDARPQIIQLGNYAKSVYKESRDALNAKGLPAPENPFNGD